MLTWTLSKAKTIAHTFNTRAKASPLFVPIFITCYRNRRLIIEGIYQTIGGNFTHRAVNSQPAFL
jgi:hypothetical protein